MSGERERDERPGLVRLGADDAAACDLPPSEFVCAGCGRPLHITLHSDMCLAEAQVYCPECEAEYQERRGRWASRE
ncbi:MAG TPA: hypothetical protein VFW96_12825 [Thermomicrobiales bacterium]|nr:hypothetical protein [Thermomicrobiales bacterium]